MRIDSDKWSLKELFEQNKKKIFSLAFHYTKNRQDAEDILQETFIKAFNGLKSVKFKSKSYFYAWLYRIGINTSIDFLRKQKRMNAEGKDISNIDIEKTCSNESSPEFRVMQNQLLNQVNSLLDTFSPRQKMTFILKYYQQLTVKEIALQFHCSAGSVKKQLFRVVSKLRKHLNFTRVRSSNEM